MTGRQADVRCSARDHLVLQVQHPLVIAPDPTREKGWHPAGRGPSASKCPSAGRRSPKRQASDGETRHRQKTKAILARLSEVGGGTFPACSALHRLAIAPDVLAREVRSIRTRLGPLSICAPSRAPGMGSTVVPARRVGGKRPARRAGRTAQGHTHPRHIEKNRLVLESRSLLDPPAEMWPSGRRHTPAKGADGEPSRGFESLRLRHSFHISH